jgi:hypothetical protein
VILARRDDAPVSEERNCSVSLVMYPRQFSWEQIKQFVQSAPPGTELLRDKLPNAASTGLAFDTWVGQPDHNDHPHNIVFGLVSNADATIADGNYVFLDYAMALGWGGGWDKDGGSSFGLAPFPPAMMAAIDTSILSGILDRIENVSDTIISEIVDRIPDEYLVTQQRTIIAEGLRTRRHHIREWLAPILGENS